MSPRSAKFIGAGLATASVLVTNPELLALILTVQAVGLELFLLLLALQARTLVESFPVALAIAKSASVFTATVLHRTGVAALRGLFPREPLRVASLQLAFAATIIVKSKSSQVWHLL
jgi:hypothetical protein